MPTPIKSRKRVGKNLLLADQQDIIRLVDRMVTWHHIWWFKGHMLSDQVIFFTSFPYAVSSKNIPFLNANLIFATSLKHLCRVWFCPNLLFIGTNRPDLVHIYLQPINLGTTKAGLWVVVLFELLFGV